MQRQQVCCCRRRPCGRDQAPGFRRHQGIRSRTATQFEKATGNKVTVEWSGTPDIQKRIAAGEAADVVILGNSGTEELIRQGKLAPGSRANFAKSGVGVAVREGTPEPDISTADAVKKAVLAAKSVAYSAGASGAYIVSMLQKMGIADQAKAKTTPVKPGEPVGAVVARGDAEIGFQQISELIPVKGIQYLGPLPPEIQNVTVFSGGVHSGKEGGRGYGAGQIPHRAFSHSDHHQAPPRAGLTGFPLVRRDVGLWSEMEGGPIGRHVWSTTRIADISQTDRHVREVPLAEAMLMAEFVCIRRALSVARKRLETGPA